MVVVVFGKKKVLKIVLPYFIFIVLYRLILQEPK